MVALGWLVARLPFSAIRALGRSIGNVFYRTSSNRRRITQINIEHCFPDLPQSEQDQLVRSTLQHVSVGALEMLVAWLNPKRDVRSRLTITGLEHLQAALAQNKGVLLVGGHFATMDIISQALQDIGHIDVMYRFNKNPVWEWLQVQGRARYFDGVVERQDVRGVLKRLKRGRAIWYAADQDYGHRHSVFAPFFGVSAATIVATSRFARLNQSPTLILSQHRDIKNMTWHIHFSPVMEGFPSGDDVTDATLLNGLLEGIVRQYPDQYLWIHKRFKTRPEGEKSFY